jgi:flavin reductase (DIM6/NTAB) family NADH-FMN oxidoreductase RutF
VAIAIARDRQGKFNPITLCWFMRVSLRPPLLAIAVGKTRYSLEAIRLSKAFVLALPSAAMARDALYFGTHSGRDADKLKACATPTQPATAIDGVLLADAVANYECRLVGETDAGDHVIFTGEVVAAHVNKDAAASWLFRLDDDRFGGVIAAPDGEG